MEKEKPVIVVDFELFDAKLKRLGGLETENAKLSKRISVLEKALRLMSEQLNYVYDEECCIYHDKIGGDAEDALQLMNDYIKQAEKELEGK